MKRRFMFLALALAIICYLAWMAVNRSREPMHQGRPLSYWLDNYFPKTAQPSGGYVVADGKAIEAIRQIGTNAIPALLQMARAHDSGRKLWLVALAKKQHIIPVPFTPASARNNQAVLGFSALGPLAGNAVPELVEIFDANISYSSRETAASALACIGPAASAAVPSLVRALAATNASLHAAVCIAALGRIHAEPQRAVPVLIRYLGDSNIGIRQRAAEALGNFGADASPAVPALIDVYERNAVASYFESYNAATALGLVGPAAAEAVPSLLRGVANPRLDNELRRLSILALGRIHAKPDAVVPVLIKSLDDDGVNISFFSIIALGQYGRDAVPAVPALTNLFQHPNPNVRIEVTNALRQIDPSAIAPGVTSASAPAGP